MNDLEHLTHDGLPCHVSPESWDRSPGASDAMMDIITGAAPNTWKAKGPAMMTQHGGRWPGVVGLLEETTLPPWPIAWALAKAWHLSTPPVDVRPALQPLRVTSRGCRLLGWWAA